MEYLIQDTTLTALADEVRELSGITDKISVDDMTSNLGEANSEVDNQTDLIAQITTALEGKAGGSGSEPELQSKTVTPTTSSQTVTADTGYDGLDTVTVNAIPSTYVKPTSTKAATTYTPSTSNQTIVAGTYCSGAQTIKGDANLIPANIVSGKTIFGVAGSAEVGDGSSTGLEWISVASLPTSYPAEPGVESANYYIELPSKQCFILFYSTTNVTSYDSHLACYDVNAGVATSGLYQIYGGTISDYAVIEDSGAVYFRFSCVSGSLKADTYYSILPTPSV